jgi:hypothetical protein
VFLFVQVELLVPDTTVPHEVSEIAMKGDVVGAIKAKEVGKVYRVVCVCMRKYNPLWPR